MLCPSCQREMHTDRAYADFACECGLAGPRDVLEGLAKRLAEFDKVRRWHGVLHDCASGGCMHTLLRHEHACAVNAVNRLHAEAERLKSPAVVLAEAERLLREEAAHEVQFLRGEVGAMARGDYIYELTLAEAYAKLKEASDG